jgi:hypothetical protein
MEDEEKVIVRKGCLGFEGFKYPAFAVAHFT